MKIRPTVRKVSVSLFSPFCSLDPTRGYHIDRIHMYPYTYEIIFYSLFIRLWTKQRGPFFLHSRWSGRRHFSSALSVFSNSAFWGAKMSPLTTGKLAQLWHESVPTEQLLRQPDRIVSISVHPLREKATLTHQEDHPLIRFLFLYRGLTRGQNR